MPKAILKAKKLEEADVSYISLVARGANRAPFKIVKNDKGEDMIQLDLSRVFKKDKEQSKKTDAAVSIVGYVIQKGDQSEVVNKALADAGAKVDGVKEFEDGTVLYAQEDAGDLKDCVVLKADDDFAIVCKGFDPYSMTEGMSFGEILKSQGFMPGFSMATEALYTTIRNSLHTAKSQSDAVSNIESALKEFGEYTTKLAGSIPQSAFKAMEAFQKAKGVALAAKAEKDAADAAAAEKTKKSADDAAAAAAAAEAAAAPAKKDAVTEDKGAQPDFAKLIGEAIAKASTDAVAATSAMLKPVTEAMDAVKKSVSDLGTKVDAVSKEAADAKAQAAKAEQVVKGATVGGLPEEDSTRKAEGEDEVEGETLGAFDTAFNRTVRKNDAARAGRRNHQL